MISVSKDSEGKVIGYVEWKQVGQSGIEKEFGEYIFLINLWIHEESRGSGALQELISDILMKAPDAKYAYFQREKYNNRMSKLYKRASVERLLRIYVH